MEDEYEDSHYENRRSSNWKSRMSFATFREQQENKQRCIKLVVILLVVILIGGALLFCILYFVVGINMFGLKGTHTCNVCQDTCQNNGTCEEAPGYCGYRCHCPPHIAGTNCELVKCLQGWYYLGGECVKLQDQQALEWGHHFQYGCLQLLTGNKSATCEVGMTDIWLATGAVDDGSSSKTFSYVKTQNPDLIKAIAEKKGPPYGIFSGLFMGRKTCPDIVFSVSNFIVKPEEEFTFFVNAGRMTDNRFIDGEPKCYDEKLSPLLLIPDEKMTTFKWKVSEPDQEYYALCKLKTLDSK